MHNWKYLQKQLVEFFQRGHEVRFSKDEIIIRQEEDPGGIFLIISGFVSCYTITSYGESNLLIIHKPGELIPLVATMDSRLPKAYYQAKTDVVLRRISRSVFFSVMSGNLTFAQTIIDQMSRLLVWYEYRIKALELRTARERVMGRLYIMCHRFGVWNDGEVLIDVPITHQDVADSINMTRETASREIERLIQEGVIERHGRMIVVKDIDTLKSVFD